MYVKYNPEGNMKKRILVLVLAAVLFVAVLSCCVKPGEKYAYTKKNMTQDVEVIITNPVDLVRREDDEFTSDRKALTVCLARNEKESMTLILRCDGADFTEQRITVGDFTSADGKVISADNIEVFRSWYIEVDTPVSLAIHPGWYPDAIIPVHEGNTPYTVKAGNNQEYRFSVSTQKDTAPGVYRGQITFDLDCGQIVFDAQITVWDFELPNVSTFRSAYGSSGFNEKIPEKTVYDFLREYRIESYYLPAADNTNAEAWWESVKDYVESPDCKSFAIRRGARIDRDTLEVTVDQFLIDIGDLLREKGYLDKAYLYIVDEPFPNDYEWVNTLHGKVKELIPGLKIIITVPSSDIEIIDELGDTTDIWVPKYSLYTEEFVKAAYAKNPDCEFWWYGCMDPNFPYPTYYISDPLIAKRLCYWMQKDYNIEGSLYWNVCITAHYNGGRYEPRDWWTEPYSFEIYDGDGSMVYPGAVGDGIVNKDIPVATVRLENVRDGIEDMEYLYLVEQQVSALIEKYALDGEVTKDDVMQSVYNQLYAATNDYYQDTENLLKMRQLLAEYILNGRDCLTVIGKTDANNTVPVRIYSDAQKVTFNGTELKKVADNGKCALYETTYTAHGGENIVTVGANGEQEYLIYIPTEPDYSADDFAADEYTDRKQPDALYPYAAYLGCSTDRMLQDDAALLGIANENGMRIAFIDDKGKANTAALDAALASFGMKGVVSALETDRISLYGGNRKYAEQSVKHLIGRYEGCSNIVGWTVNAKNAEYAARTVKALRELDPVRFVGVKVLSVNDFDSAEEYNKYIDEVITSANPDIIYVDAEPIVETADNGKIVYSLMTAEKYDADYISELRKISAVCGEKGIPFAVYVQLRNHVDEQRVKWQISMAYAYGAKQVVMREYAKDGDFENPDFATHDLSAESIELAKAVAGAKVEKIFTVNGNGETYVPYNSLGAITADAAKGATATVTFFDNGVIMFTDDRLWLEPGKSPFAQFDIAQPEHSILALDTESGEWVDFAELASSIKYKNGAYIVKTKPAQALVLRVVGY